MKNIETYITNRVKETIGGYVISFLLKQIDDIPSNELDYLQIFTIQKLSKSTIVIEHSQEVPPRTKYYYLVDDIIKEESIKLYLIYENEYRVFMYADEY